MYDVELVFRVGDVSRVCKSRKGFYIFRTSVDDAYEKVVVRPARVEKGRCEKEKAPRVERSSYRGDFWVRDSSRASSGGSPAALRMRPSRARCPPPRALPRGVSSGRGRARARGSPARGPRASRSAVLRALEREPPRVEPRGEPGRRTGGMRVRTARVLPACVFAARSVAGRVERRSFRAEGERTPARAAACASDWNAYEFSRGRGRNTSRRRLSRRDRAGGSGRFGVKSVTSEKRISASPRSVNRKSRADRKNQTDPPVETRGARLPFILGVAFSFCTRDLLGRATPPRTPRHSNARAHTRRRRKRSRGRPKRLGRLPAHGGLALGAAAYRPFFAVRRIGRRRTHR